VAAAGVVASGVGDRILVPGYVPEADKAALLTGADVFAYPSRPSSARPRGDSR
jgi:glycosyltransferase involved in cell wall biosynthesis